MQVQGQETITPNTSHLYRYEVKSLIAKSVMFAIDCEHTNCDKFVGGIRVSRLRPDMVGFEKQYDIHVNHENYKYPLVFKSHTEILQGIYYIEVSYNNEEAQDISYELVIEESQENDSIDQLATHKYTYGALTEGMSTGLYSIHVMTSQELPEPIVLTVTPLNAHFTVCLSPNIISMDEGANKPF
jgi:hypothetical protein